MTNLSLMVCDIWRTTWSRLVDQLIPEAEGKSTCEECITTEKYYHTVLYCTYNSLISLYIYFYHQMAHQDFLPPV